MLFTSTEVPFDQFGFSSYRIEVELSDRFRPLQRHVWTANDGGKEIDPWIRTLYGDPDYYLAKGWTRVSEVSEGMTTGYGAVAAR